MIKSVDTSNGSLNLLLLGYADSPAEHPVPGPDNSPVWPALPQSPSNYDAIVLGPNVDATQIVATRNQAPDATIIAHLPDNAAQEDVLRRIQWGADDVVFDSHMAIDQLLSTQVLIARERRHAAQNLQQVCATDTLTGLPDRQQFLSRLQQMLDANHQERIAVMIVDIDAFKSINDSLGHRVGDELLHTVGERLLSLADDGAYCARVGHDHFAIAIDNTRDMINASIYAETVVSLVRKPYHLLSAAQDLYITVSLGLTLEDNGVDDAEALVRQANMALTQARQKGRCMARYEPVLAADAHYKHALRNSLHNALARHELSMVYQPQVDMRSGRSDGVEALLRWHHPTLGSIPPDAFIPLMEETGLITAVGMWIIDTVCAQLRTWGDAGKVDANFSAAINISSKQFHDSDLAGYIEQAITHHGLNPRQIKLELTESLLVVDTELVAAKLKRLKALGIAICIDDFGTGYASLSYLRQFPIDVLKIDKSFTQSIGLSEQNDAIVLAIINLAHELHFHVVAEGVETQSQRAFLAQHNCDTFQGYLFGRPVPAAEVHSHIDVPAMPAYIHVACVQNSL
jgi:diguanylate cyclase (GGDEF)-like protein